MKLVDRINWWIDVQPKLSSNASTLLALQAFKYVDRHGLHWYSSTSMAADTGMSERTVRRCQQELEDAGLIERTPRWVDAVGRDSGQPTHYRKADLVKLLVRPPEKPTHRVVR